MVDDAAKLSEENSRLVRESFNGIRPVADDFVTTLYDRLFEVAPAARALFSQNLQTQRDKLLATLTTVVRASRNLDALSTELVALGRAHQEYGVKPEHYDILVDVVLWTLERYLGDAFTPSHRDAWISFLSIIADTMEPARRQDRTLLPA